MLGRGQLVVTGVARCPSSGDANPVHYAITGGTGVHSTARGQATVTPISGGSDRIVIDVITG